MACRSGALECWRDGYGKVFFSIPKGRIKVIPTPFQSTRLENEVSGVGVNICSLKPPFAQGHRCFPPGNLTLSDVVLDTLILGETRLPPLASLLIVAFFA